MKHRDQDFFRGKFEFSNWFGLVLILLFGIPRFVVVLQANVTGNYNLTSVLFLVMIALPYLILTRKGRREIGMVKPEKPKWLVFGFLSGILMALAIGEGGYMLFNLNIENWYVYISRSYTLPEFDSGSNEKFIYFLIFAAIGMSFSPMGEELLYRGVIHRAFTRNFGEHGASILDSLAFSITHLAHFGIIYHAGSWKLLAIPAIIWVIFMFLASRLFFIIKIKSGSVYGAVASHAGFNLGMTWFIFYSIL